MSSRLNECSKGARVKIVRIDAGTQAALNMMRLGINLGDIVTIMRTSFLRGPMVVGARGTEVAIGHGLAGKIVVDIDAESA